MIKVYTAKAMTGKKGRSLLAQSKRVKQILSKYGIIVLDPVEAEKVKNTNQKLNNSGGLLSSYWARDKRMIREAHVLLDISGPAKSEGVAHEIGYARYTLWKPVVRVYVKEKSRISVAVFEDDYIASSVEDAAKLIASRWGTLPKRIKWRLFMLVRCLPRWIKYQLGEFK